MELSLTRAQAAVRVQARWRGNRLRIMLNEAVVNVSIIDEQILDDVHVPPEGSEGNRCSEREGGPRVDPPLIRRDEWREYSEDLSVQRRKLVDEIEQLERGHYYAPAQKQRELRRQAKAKRRRLQTVEWEIRTLRTPSVQRSRLESRAWRMKSTLEGTQRDTATIEGTQHDTAVAVSFDSASRFFKNMSTTWSTFSSKDAIPATAHESLRVVLKLRTAAGSQDAGQLNVPYRVSLSRQGSRPNSGVPRQEHSNSPPLSVPPLIPPPLPPPSSSTDLLRSEASVYAELEVHKRHTLHAAGDAARLIIPHPNQRAFGLKREKTVKELHTLDNDSVRAAAFVDRPLPP